MSDPERRTLTVEEAARIIGISRTTAYECVRNGAIPSIRYGRRIVIPRWAIDDPLTSSQNNAVPSLDYLAPAKRHGPDTRHEERIGQ